ncbi:copper ion binding protein [Caloramator quimbayensis]|uniref:Copper ion binding protein n=2 Tax=Caloramator quimbayensis TaxID=1147123 RepID=A0A1T4XTQ0_9CLOT|nr:copper ion binding protein [Caloramator quimbayensis]
MKKINIEGMSCMHCVMHVKNALNEVKGVSKVDVDLKGKFATVEGENIIEDDLRQAIEDAGYEVVSIEEA